jgi:hypothetical protein
MIATLALASTVLAIMSYNILNTKEEPPPKQAGEIASAKATDALGVPAARETNDRSDHSAE